MYSTQCLALFEDPLPRFTDDFLCLSFSQSSTPDSRSLKHSRMSEDVSSHHSCGLYVSDQPFGQISKTLEYPHFSHNECAVYPWPSLQSHYCILRERLALQVSLFDQPAPQQWTQWKSGHVTPPLALCEAGLERRYSHCFLYSIAAQTMCFRPLCQLIYIYPLCEPRTSDSKLLITHTVFESSSLNTTSNPQLP
jgi:hypothetical protein